MNFIVMMSMFFLITANATDFSGVYYKNGATIEIVNKKSVIKMIVAAPGATRP